MTVRAELYDAIHTGTPGDVAFYVRLARGATSVLELGCGSGRVLVALAAAGLRATGLERDRDMLEAARKRIARAGPDVAARTTLVQGDMARFSLGERFDRVIIPYSGLYCMLTPDRLVACLRAAREHLAPGGLFAFDAYSADEFHERARPEDYPDDRLEPVADIVHAGEPLTVYEMSRWNRRTQRIDATYLYVARDGSTRHTQTIGHRYVRRRQLEPVLARAGLELVSVHGDFEGTPHALDSNGLVVLARAASD